MTGWSLVDEKGRSATASSTASSAGSWSLQEQHLVGAHGRLEELLPSLAIVPRAGLRATAPEAGKAPPALHQSNHINSTRLTEPLHRPGLIVSNALFRSTDFASRTSTLSCVTLFHTCPCSTLGFPLRWVLLRASWKFRHWCFSELSVMLAPPLCELTG